MWANRSICSYSDFNLAYVAEFQYKTGYATTKNGRYGNPQHTFFTNGIYFVVLNESLNTINKGNGNKVSSVGIIVFHVEAA